MSKVRRNNSSPLKLSLFALIIGLLSGVGAVLFRGLIALIHNIAFTGHVTTSFDSSLHTIASPLGIGIIFIPIIGAILVVYLVKNYAPEAKGHGVPEVMGAIYHHSGIIRPIVASIKSLASAISIGTGGSVGREGPIIQIGATLGSSLAQWLNLPVWQRITLLACGASSGIAATFNTPVGGILFAVELMLHEVSARTLVPVALATASATLVGRWAFGDHPAFFIPKTSSAVFTLSHPLLFIHIIVLGVLTGLTSYLYIKSIYAAEDFFEAKLSNPYIRHTLGMFILGLFMFIMMKVYGHYYIQGVGYATIQDILSDTRLPIYFLILLFVLKLFATMLTLGSGASGGIFSPGLFLGATLGAFYSQLVASLFPSLSLDHTGFVIAAMAGIIGGSTSAALAAIVMIFEMTLDYSVILPVTIVVAISYGVRVIISKESIYTLKLSRKGLSLPASLNTNFEYLVPAQRFMQSTPRFLPSQMLLHEFTIIAKHAHKKSCFLVRDSQKKILGFVLLKTALKAFYPEKEGVSLGQLADPNFVWVQHNTTLIEVLTELQSKDAEIALVLGPRNLPEHPIGIVTRMDIEAAIESSVSMYDS